MRHCNPLSKMAIEWRGDRTKKNWPRDDLKSKRGRLNLQDSSYPGSVVSPGVAHHTARELPCAVHLRPGFPEGETHGGLRWLGLLTLKEQPQVASRPRPFKES